MIKKRNLLIIAIFFVILLSIQLITITQDCTINMFGIYSYAAENATLSFSNNGINEVVAGSGYSINGTTLTISSAGTYRIAGTCSEGNIVIEKKLSDVNLILDGLTLTSKTTAPILVKKSSTVNISLVGTNTLTDNEDSTTEETNSDFEGACIKVKSGSSLQISGSGTLNGNGNAKNGIKGASESLCTINSGIINVNAENNGIAFDGSIVINNGTITINSDNDAIKAVPDEDDTTSEGIITINGGTITINANGDGIQAGSDLSINDGVFNIKTLNGYNSSNFDSSTMSCKGLKASGNDSDSETEDVTNTITIKGGVFSLNTADDAIHSDGYINVTGGTFDIYTGDDGIHADTSLTLGTENGYERDPEVNIYKSYEGLEAGTIYAYSGKYYVISSDDGINAAGGSSNGSDPGFGGGNSFNPGGRPGGSSSNGDYSINIYGGKFYINVDGDGIDSNGDLNLYGGEITVFGQKTGGDNSPLDSDGTLLIKGATVFAAGTNPMNETPASSSQKYYTNTTSRSAGTIVNITYNGSVVYSDKLTKNINYLLYSNPNMTSNNCTVSTASTVTTCKSNAWSHNWNSGVITKAATSSSTGVKTYTCSDCNLTERKTITKTTSNINTSSPSTNNSTTNTNSESNTQNSTTTTWQNPFKDVKTSDWFYEAVKYTNSNGIIAGYNSTTFAPNDKLTRAMIVTILYRMEGEPTNNGKSIFSDVETNQWYSKAIKWAADNGIVHGYGGTNNFGPNDNIIRQDLAGILRNYSVYKKKNTNTSGDLTKFKDYKSVSDYALTSMKWAVGTGVITGNSDGTLNPKGNATRAEAAAMIQKYCNKVGR